MNRRDFGKLCGLACLAPAFEAKSETFTVPVQKGERFMFCTSGRWSGDVTLEINEGYGFCAYVPAYRSDYDMNVSLTGIADVASEFRMKAKMKANIKGRDSFRAIFSNECTSSQWVA
jgi:hypothetical protein